MHPQHQPRPQSHRHRAARPAKRVHKPLFILGVPVVVIAAIAVGTDDDTGAGSTGEREPRARPTTVPEYKVIRENMGGKTGKADLLMPKARPEAAEAAIRDYAEKIDGPRAVSVGVVRSEDAAVVVCRGEWREDERAARLYGGEPGLAAECPDPVPIGSDEGDRAAAEKAAGIPPKPTGAARTAYLDAVREIVPALAAEPDKAVDAGRNQCAALGRGSTGLDRLAAQRFGDGAHPLTEAQGGRLNAVLRKTLCPEP